MAIKEMQPRLQLTSEEFAETWCALIEEYYQRGLSPDIIESCLHLSGDGAVHYTTELSMILLFIAMENWNSRKRISQDIRAKSTDAVVECYFNRMFGEAEQESYKVYDKRRMLFSQLCHHVADANPQKRQPELIGFARYLTAQVSERQEQQNVEAIQQLSILFIEAAATFFRFASNSFPDLQGFGKTKFIVQK